MLQQCFRRAFRLKKSADHASQSDNGLRHKTARTSLPKTVNSLDRPYFTSIGTLASETPAAASKSFRYPIAWRDPDYYNEALLENEVRRVFDVCHGCRLCYSLCDSFPRLFDLVDESKTGELDSVPSSEFKKVADACTLCDICFMNKCPYTPPHALNVDFPHLILRLKALDNAQSNTANVKLEQPSTFPSVKESSGTKSTSASGSVGQGDVHTIKGLDRALHTSPEPFYHALYANMDLLAPISSLFSPLTNWITRVEGNSSIRHLLAQIFRIHPSAQLPKFVPPSQTLTKTSKRNPYKIDKTRKAYQDKKKVILYATCNGNYNKPNPGNAFRAILARHGVICQVEYEGCCGMPQLESGQLKDVSGKAKLISKRLRRFVDDGYDVVTPVASCTLMFKKEWPLLEPEDLDIRALSEKTFDMSEYLVKLQKEGYLDPIPELERSVTLHHACHSRAQNMGFKSQQLLQSVPKLQISSIERCSGHGGSFGVQAEGHHLAMKVGKPVFTRTLTNASDRPEQQHFIASDCPLAVDHIVQGVGETAKEKSQHLKHSPTGQHPVELVAMAYQIRL
jgi:glycerol-3-phosphate dehydrogenase subunit C